MWGSSRSGTEFSKWSQFLIMSRSKGREAPCQMLSQSLHTRLSIFSLWCRRIIRTVCSKMPIIVGLRIVFGEILVEVSVVGPQRVQKMLKWTKWTIELTVSTLVVHLLLVLFQKTRSCSPWGKLAYFRNCFNYIDGVFGGSVSVKLEAFCFCRRFWYAFVQSIPLRHQSLPLLVIL